MWEIGTSLLSASEFAGCRACDAENPTRSTRQKQKAAQAKKKTSPVWGLCSASTMLALGSKRDCGDWVCHAIATRLNETSITFHKSNVKQMIRRKALEASLCKQIYLNYITTCVYVYMLYIYMVYYRYIWISIKKFSLRSRAQIADRSRPSLPSSCPYEFQSRATWAGVSDVRREAGSKKMHWKRANENVIHFVMTLCFNKNAEETQKVHEVKTQTVL